MTLNPQTKRILDYLPLVVFFIGYKWLGIRVATAMLLVTTLFSLIFIYFVERRIAPAPLITAIMVTIFGGLTLWLQDNRFIQIKPTVIYFTFFSILMIGFLFKKNLLKGLFSDALELSEAGWRVLTLRTALFFLLLAVLNEYVRRSFSMDAWVYFKVFGCVGLTFVFFLLQASLIQRHGLPPSQDEQKPR